jgi:hypothetical protein
LGGQNKRVQKENALFVINAGHWQSCPAAGTAKLEVSIFQALHSNGHRIDFNVLLSDVMVIADEVDSQLAQAMASSTAL